MTDYNLSAKARIENGKKTRNAGLIPAVVYGKHIKNLNVALDKINFNRLFKEAGTSNLIDLNIDNDKPFKTLVHDVQLDPITLEVNHVDFYKVNMKEKITAEIPLVFVGESRAVVDLEGSLITPKDSVEVECLPADLIPEIKIDISILDDFEKDIRVSDLKVPANIEILDDPEEVIAHVEEPRSEEELEALKEEVVEDVNTVEVEAEKKEEETADTGESGEAKTKDTDESK